MKLDEALSLPGVDAQVMRRRALSVASRLLAGAGRAEVLAFRAQPQRTFPVLAHALLPDGSFVVAVSAGADVRSASLDVRLDIGKDAPEPTLRIRAATLHALGHLVWMDAGVGEPESLQLPTLLGELADVPGVRLARIDFAKVLLHDCAGVTALPWGELQQEAPRNPFPLGADELTAAEAVSAMTTAQWVEVVQAVLTGRRPGVELSRIELGAVCSHNTGSVRCVDVDTTGVTVMHFGSTGAATIYVPFETPVTDLGGVRAGLGVLLASSLASAH